MSESVVAMKEKDKIKNALSISFDSYNKWTKSKRDIKKLRLV